MWACIVTKIKHTQYSNSSEDTHPSPDQTARMDPSDLQAWIKHHNLNPKYSNFFLIIQNQFIKLELVLKKFEHKHKPIKKFMKLLKKIKIIEGVEKT